MKRRRHIDFGAIFATAEWAALFIYAWLAFFRFIG
jgi:hypothetical protein